MSGLTIWGSHAASPQPFFLGQETLLATQKPAMAVWREKLFAVMTRNAQSAMPFFRILPGRMVELGSQVEL